MRWSGLLPASSPSLVSRLRQRSGAARAGGRGEGTLPPGSAAGLLDQGDGGVGSQKLAAEWERRPSAWCLEGRARGGPQVALVTAAMDRHCNASQRAHPPGPQTEGRSGLAAVTAQVRAAGAQSAGVSLV